MRPVKLTSNGSCQKCCSAPFALHFKSTLVFSGGRAPPHKSPTSCQISNQSLSGFSDHFSSLGIPAASPGEKSAGGLEPEPAQRHSAPAGVRPDWGVIGLSRCPARFPMWATAVWRPGGTIWKQRDVLQRRRSIQWGADPEKRRNKAGQGTSLHL